MEQLQTFDSYLWLKNNYFSIYFVFRFLFYPLTSGWFGKWKTVYTNHELEKENDCAVPSQSHLAKKIPIAITTRRFPLDRLQTSGGETYIAAGGLCETTFLELNDSSANLDANFIEFKQQQQQQQNQMQSSMHPAGGYERETLPSMGVYGSSYSPSQGPCYLSEAGDFVGVASLDILQGVRQGTCSAHSGIPIDS